MRLTVLGTATPYPRPGNACSGYLVQSEQNHEQRPDAPDPASPAAPGRPVNVWVDAGTGTLAELQRHIDLDELDAVFISHRHADHSADLLVAYYALRFAELRPAHPIPLFGPEGLLERLAAFLGPNSVDELPRVFDFRPLSGFGEARIGELALSWGPVQHGVPAFGLTVDEGEGEGEGEDEDEGDGEGAGEGANARRFAYSGDSAPCLSLEEIAENADLLLIEAGYPTSDAAGTDAPAHHTPEDTGRTATTSGARHLVLTHIADTVPPAEARSRASAYYDGPITIAEPGSRIPI